MIPALSLLVVLLAVAIVVWPLTRSGGGRRVPRPGQDLELRALQSQRNATLFALSELESDYDMGSLSQSDYARLRQRYEERAISLMKEMDGLEGEHGAEALSQDIEAEVLALRRAGRKSQNTACASCGAPAADGDAYCSQCGRLLQRACPRCAAPIEADDRFCAGCGAQVA
jgi:hypothetical protein